MDVYASEHLRLEIEVERVERVSGGVRAFASSVEPGNQGAGVCLSGAQTRILMGILVLSQELLHALRFVQIKVTNGLPVEHLLRHEETPTLVEVPRIVDLLERQEAFKVLHRCRFHPH